jgi:hypothetical protein
LIEFLKHFEFIKSSFHKLGMMVYTWEPHLLVRLRQKDHGLRPSRAKVSKTLPQKQAGCGGAQLWSQLLGEGGGGSRRICGPSPAWGKVQDPI